MQQQPESGFSRTAATSRRIVLETGQHPAHLEDAVTTPAQLHHRRHY